ncbi:hypothetical protein G7085_16375 [Tessaracoccus sp. HDW20]|uniref:hypothetical protein n=1 Tax=Tessaracoccus coleopterorum TaxID=2714950 RepID=UPI0018D4442B|nr:hypothetical protein [Tessaracoccus coleopterorum]NHB85638.1 hypothetical protein [Tessaracoccus coleopterorum]
MGQEGERPCPTACNGTLPTINLTDGERADTIGVRLVLEESPNRLAISANDPLAPAVGSGVARSNDGTVRQLNLRFQLRDELRVSPSGKPEPVLSTSTLSGGKGIVANAAGITGLPSNGDQPAVNDTDDATISVTDVPPPSTSPRSGPAARSPSPPPAPRRRAGRAPS